MVTFVTEWRKPRAADLPASLSGVQPNTDQEGVEVDRQISGVCRGR
jgi:hypothetical protein